MKKLIAYLTAAAGVLAASFLAYGPKEPLRGNTTLGDYLATFSTGTNKKEWVVDRPCEIVGVRVNTGATDRTTGSDIIDVNVNGTTIFTTQGNRPTQAAASTGDWTVGYPDGVRVLKAGDVVAWDGDTASTGGTGKTRITLAISLRYL